MAAFCLKNQDHTLGNLVKTRLLRDPEVRFAGYRVPHPSEALLEMRVDAPDPTAATIRALGGLSADLDEFEQRFLSAVRGRGRAGQFQGTDPRGTPAPAFSPDSGCK